jgi:hypothetical protein
VRTARTKVSMLARWATLAVVFDSIAAISLEDSAWLVVLLVMAQSSLGVLLWRASELCQRHRWQEAAPRHAASEIEYLHLQMGFVITVPVQFEIRTYGCATCGIVKTSRVLPWHREESA